MMRVAFFYLLIFLSGGQFALVWIFLMAFEAQRLGARFSGNLKAYAMVFALTYLAYQGVIIYGVYQFLYSDVDWLSKYFIYLIPVAFGLLICIWKILIGIAQFLRSKSINIPNNFVLFLMLLLYGSLLPYLQIKLSRVEQI